jgi:hypothetical protein
MEIDIVTHERAAAITEPRGRVVAFERAVADCHDARTHADAALGGAARLRDRAIWSLADLLAEPLKAEPPVS